MARIKGSQNKAHKSDTEKTVSRSVSLTHSEWEYLESEYPHLTPTLAVTRIVRQFIARKKESFDL